MLAKRKRANKKEVQNIIKKGKRLYSNIFTCLFLSSSPTKTTFIVPKKVTKKAIERNKMRRIGYNTIRLFGINNIKNSQVFIYKIPLKNTNKEQIKKEIIFLISKQNNEKTTN